MPSRLATASAIFKRDPTPSCLVRIIKLGYLSGGEFTPLSFEQWARLAVELKQFPTRRQRVAASLANDRSSRRRQGSRPAEHKPRRQKRNHR